MSMAPKTPVLPLGNASENLLRPPHMSKKTIHVSRPTVRETLSMHPFKTFHPTNQHPQNANLHLRKNNKKEPIIIIPLKMVFITSHFITGYFQGYSLFNKISLESQSTQRLHLDQPPPAKAHLKSFSSKASKKHLKNT